MDSQVISRPSLPPLSPLLNNLLPLRINFLIIDLPRRLALLPLRRLRRLHANSRRAATSDLLLRIFPGSTSVIYFVSGGWKSVIAHSLRYWVEMGKVDRGLTGPVEERRSTPFAFPSALDRPAGLLLRVLLRVWCPVA